MSHIFDDDLPNGEHHVSPSAILRNVAETVGDPSGNAGLVGWWARNAGQFTALGVMLILFGLGSFAVLYQMDRMYRDAREERAMERAERAMERAERKAEAEQRAKMDESRATHMRSAEDELRKLNGGVQHLTTTIEELNRRIKPALTNPAGDD